MNRSTPMLRAADNQRRAALLALVLAVGAFWVSVPLGRWPVGVFVSVGIALGLVNQVLTELSLLRSIEGGELLTRGQFAMTSLLRLVGISVVAAVLAVAFWPDGATVLIGLAIFHLIVLVLTGLPLLREMRKA